MKALKFIESILNVDVTNTNVRIFGSSLIILSGLILFSDKVLSFKLEHYFGFGDSQTLIWMTSQTLCPILLILGNILKPYKTSYLPVVYVLAIQMFWIFDGSARFDDYLLQTYAIGSMFIVCLVSYLLSKVKAMQDREISEAKEELEEAREVIKIAISRSLNKAV